jgi:hypothetical protein
LDGRQGILGFLYPWSRETTCEIIVHGFVWLRQFVDLRKLDRGRGNRLEGINQIILRGIIVGVYWRVIDFRQLLLWLRRRRRWRVLFVEVLIKIIVFFFLFFFLNAAFL